MFVIKHILNVNNIIANHVINILTLASWSISLEDGTSLENANFKNNTINKVQFEMSNYIGKKLDFKFDVNNWSESPLLLIGEPQFSNK